MSNLTEGQSSRTNVQTWGVTAASALAGGIILQASAEGVIAFLVTLTAPPIALTLGAIGGGLWGWRWMQSRSQATADLSPVTQNIVTQAVASPETNVATQAPVAEEAVEQQSFTTEVETIAIVEANLTEANVVEAIPVETIPVETIPVEAILVEAIPVETNVAGILLQPALVGESTSSPAMPDPLEEIHGIGPVIANRLRAAGIHTFAQLAELSPEQIKEAIAPLRASSRIDFAHWIAEARQRVGIAF